MDGTIEGVIHDIIELKPKPWVDKKTEETKYKEGKRFFVQRGKEYYQFDLDRWSRFADDTHMIEGFHPGDKVEVRFNLCGKTPFTDKNGELSNFTRLKVINISLLSDELDLSVPKEKRPKKTKKIDIPAYNGQFRSMDDQLADPMPEYKPVEVPKPFFDENGEIDDSQLPF